MTLQTDVSRLLVTGKYRYQDQTKRDIMSAITNYKNLSPVLDKYVFTDGNQKDLICLSGTIPVPYRGAVYNIPVAIWLTDSHPYSAPFCYVRPTKDMTIKVSKHVDTSGRIFLPYLSDWTANSSDLLGVIQVMICVFGEMPPVYSKPKNVTQSAEIPVSGASVMTPFSSSGIPVVYQNPNCFQPMPRISNSSMGATSTPYPTQYPPQYPYSGGYQANNTAQPYIPSSTNNAYPYPQNFGTTYTSQPTTTQPPQELSPGGTGTITEEHIRASLISAIEDKIKLRIKEKKSQFQAEMDVLTKTSQDLNKGKQRLEDIIRRMDDEMIEINECKQQLNAKNGQLAEVISKCDDTEKNVDIDEVFGPTQPLYKQLLNSFAEENAIVDAIYYLSEALRKGVIDLEIFLKHVRELSRRQFMLRALMRVCREKAGLPV